MQQSEKILLVLSLAPTLSAHCSKIITVILIMSKVLSSTFSTKRGQTRLAPDLPNVVVIASLGKQSLLSTLK